MLLTLTNRTWLLLAAAIVLLAGSFVIFASATREAEETAARKADSSPHLRCPNAGPIMGGVIDEPPLDDPEWDIPRPNIRARVTEPLKPRFTELAWKHCVNGVVIVEVLLDAEGGIRDGRVLKGLPFDLDKQAAAAAVEATYEPARNGDEPVPSRLVITIPFNPNDERQRPAPR